MVEYNKQLVHYIGEEAFILSKFQLTLSTDYVPDWTCVEAVRELFQNALDNQTVNPENEMFWEYLAAENILRIGNKTSVLTLDSLLLGFSTKRDDERTIGTHGEGYKIALMVLLREGKEVTIYNYGRGEVWRTRLVRSRKFNGVSVPEILVDRKYRWLRKPSHDLIIEIRGISEEEYQAIVESNLHLQGELEGYSTENNSGFILTDPKYQGKIFVNGLFICHNTNFRYGYDVNPKYIRLDRDRKLVDTIDLAFVTSRMWRYANQPKLVAQMLMADVLDVRYIKSLAYYRPYSDERQIDSDIQRELREEFKSSYGNNAVPVSDNYTLERVQRSKQDVRPVLVSKPVVEYLENDDEVASVEFVPVKTRLMEWYEGVESKLTEEEKDSFLAILEDL